MIDLTTQPHHGPASRGGASNFTMWNQLTLFDILVGSFT